MPQPRRASPRNKDRRSRSYSPRRQRSRSRSYSRDRSRSRERRRSPPRKRSPERSQRWSPRHRSQSSERDYARQQVKPHSGDIPDKRSARRSRTPSPYSRDKKLKQEPSPYDHRRRSPSPGPSRKSRPEHISSSRSEHNSSGRSEHVSSARAPLFPSTGTGKKREIDYVIIVNRGPKMERLNKRFETLEQQAAGPFDFEENITIGIHRGPSANVHLYDDEDVPVNYDFNTKTFKMLHRKKYYEKAIFDRDEIKAFHHDDILDEEAYVEKRTISVKPVDKPRRDDRRDDMRDEIDFRVTHRTDRDDPYVDRRMVRSHEPSRSQRYEDIPVTVRLDPKPDPRYERIYRSQQRHGDQPENFRDPGDLRNSLLRRKPEGGMVDARSRIDARRMEEDDVSPDRHSQDMDRKRSSYKQDLPDFKNRPGKFKEDWENNPTATPRNFRYFLHDSRSRDDMNYWERKQMYLQTGRYPGRGQRGRGFRARGRGFVPRGRGRGFYRGGYKPGFTEQPTYESSAEPWKHDKYDEDEYGEESESHDKEPKEKKVKKKEKKEKEGKKSTKKKHSDKEVNKEEEDLKQQERIEITIS